jgi:hypothetical protein
MTPTVRVIRLIRKKSRLPHGMFLPWIETEFEMSHKTATKFMNVAQSYGGKVELGSTIGLAALYELAAPSAREERPRSAPPQPAGTGRHGVCRATKGFYALGEFSGSMFFQMKRIFRPGLAPSFSCH